MTNSNTNDSPKPPGEQALCEALDLILDSDRPGHASWGNVLDAIYASVYYMKDYLFDDTAHIITRRGKWRDTLEASLVSLVSSRSFMQRLTGPRRYDGFMMDPIALALLDDETTTLSSIANSTSDRFDTALLNEKFEPDEFAMIYADDIKNSMPIMLDVAARVGTQVAYEAAAVQKWLRNISESANDHRSLKERPTVIGTQDQCAAVPHPGCCDAHDSEEEASKRTAKFVDYMTCNIEHPSSNPAFSVSHLPGTDPRTLTAVFDATGTMYPIRAEPLTDGATDTAPALIESADASKAYIKREDAILAIDWDIIYYDWQDARLEYAYYSSYATSKREEALSSR